MIMGYARVSTDGQSLEAQDAQRYPAVPHLDVICGRSRIPTAATRVLVVRLAKETQTL